MSAVRGALMGTALAVVVSVSSGARAADAGASEAATLETQLTRETTELSTSDCAVACRALASIRRAAERICELEPGPRCTAARAKADAAAKRVRDACPECALAAAPPPPPPAPPPEPQEERVATKDSPSPTSGPPAESERGGCRSCATIPAAPAPGDLLVFAAAAAALLRRRRNSRRRL